MHISSSGPAFFAIAAAAASLAQAAETRSTSAAAAPASEYRSTLDGYRRFTDENVGSWRATNDTVRAVGGWRAYAREAQAPASATQGSGSSAPASSADRPHQPQGGRR